MTPLERVSARVSRLGDVNKKGTPLPLLTIAEFFDGNETVGSIGCNLPGAPPASVMRALCEGIAAQDSVKDVRVLVTQFDEPDWWPFSDAIYVMTSAEPEEVRSWFPEELAPDEVFLRLFDDNAFEPYDVPPRNSSDRVLVGLDTSRPLKRGITMGGYYSLHGPEMNS